MSELTPERATEMLRLSGIHMNVLNISTPIHEYSAEGSCICIKYYVYVEFEDDPNDNDFGISGLPSEFNNVFIVCGGKCGLKAMR